MSERPGPADPTDPPDPDEPEFGPGGYLPQRAAKRARKIVLRAPMGMHWIWGAVAVGVGVLVVGVAFLATAGGPPGPPFVPLGPVAAVVADGPGMLATPDAPHDGHLVSTQAGRLRIFEVADDDIAWCEASRRFEGSDGVWSPTGRGLGGASSLPEHPSVIVDGILYWDATTTLPGPVEDPTEVERAC